jgi:hypothetical protein
MNVPGHDTNFTFSGFNDTGTIGTNEFRGGLPVQMPLDLDHVLLWNAFGNAHNQWNFCFNGFHNGGGGEGRRYINDTFGCLVGTNVQRKQRKQEKQKIVRIPCTHQGVARACVVAPNRTDATKQPKEEAATKHRTKTNSPGIRVGGVFGFFDRIEHRKT